MKVSIVIPTITYVLIKECLDYLTRFTRLDDVEIIVVSNGISIDDLKKLENYPIKLLTFDKPLGPVPALNIGIKEARGEFIVLLNDDCTIAFSDWLDVLLKPFDAPNVGMTGPGLVNYRHTYLKDFAEKKSIGESFLIFMCVAIRRELFNKIGLLDENLISLVDMDFNIASSLMGYKSVGISGHIVYHEGESTVSKYYGGRDRWYQLCYEDAKKLEIKYRDIGERKLLQIKDSSSILEKLQTEYLDSDVVHKTNTRQIYNPNWSMSQKKYEILAVQELMKNDKIEKILEIGTFAGGTALLWAHMVAPYNGKVYCVDINFTDNDNIFNGGKNLYKDTPYEKFVIELEGDSQDTEFIKKVKDTVGKVDMLFIDGDHLYTSVKNDFYNFRPLVKKGGYILLHDIINTEVTHPELRVFVERFWNELKIEYPDYLEFKDMNRYIDAPQYTMGIGVIKI